MSARARTVLMSVGDIILDAEGHETALRHVAPLLRSADLAIANCDQVYADDRDGPDGFWPIRHGAPPGTAAMLGSVLEAGITVVNLGNNHVLDWGYPALAECLANLRAQGAAALGAGANIQEARAPVLLDTPGGRIGCLAYCSVGPDGYEATPERPGFAPMRAHTHYQQWDPQPGTPPLIRTFADRADLAAMCADIAALRAQVDVVAVSQHWGVHFIPGLIADYQIEVGHAAIDAGADVIFGTHPHLPKGIEVYRGKVIFHGMNDFATPGSWRAPGSQPGARYPQSVTWDWTGLGRLLEERFGQVPPEEKTSSMIAKIVVERGEIRRVSFIPCHLGPDSLPMPVPRGDPRAAAVADHFERLSHSQGFGTRLSWDGDEVVISAAADPATREEETGPCAPSAP